MSTQYAIAELQVLSKEFSLLASQLEAHNDLWFKELSPALRGHNDAKKRENFTRF